MKKLVSTLNLPKEEWLKYRKQGIGGSDAGAICGLNPYRSAIQVYYDKTTEDIEDIDNEAMRQGREMEDYVARRFMEETGKKVRRANAMFYNEENKFMLADVDRMVVGENAGLECKTTSPFMAEYWSGDKIPLSYQMQCYHYMSVCNADAWYVAVLIYGKEFKVYKLERDEEIIANMIRLEKNFWENNVLKRILPEPDGSKLADSVIAEYYKESTGAVIPLHGFDDKLKRREELVELINKIETEKRLIEQELKMYLGDAEKAENQLFRVSWKEVVSSRFDTKALQEQEPDVYKKYLKQTSSRRFMVKSA
ncbi:MAG: YqaJ viral recombinase family protein [Lachnospiraceae bacterium]|nr:YqaJ viral recombinase family protein [Lachnospiraceae bacterium]